MDPRIHLDETMRGYQTSSILLTAARLGLFAAIGRGSRPVGEIAVDLDCDERATRIILLALAAEGFLEHEDGRFCIAPAYSEFLLPGGKQTMASILNHNHHLLGNWARLEEVVRSGRSVQHASRDERQLRDFICGMADISRRSSREVADGFDMSPHRRMLDLGGGPGTAAIVFAERWPQLTGVVFDKPEVVAIAEEQIAIAGLQDRVTTMAGDYYVDELGEGFDLVYISNIIHSMPPTELTMIAARAHRALVAGGTLIIKDIFLDDSLTEPAGAAVFSVNMLINTEGGKSYSLTETREILAGTGFVNFEAMEIARNSKLLIARKT